MIGYGVGNVSNYGGDWCAVAPYLVDTFEGGVYDAPHNRGVGIGCGFQWDEVDDAIHGIVALVVGFVGLLFSVAPFAVGAVAEVVMPPKGDFKVNGQYLFEVGGSGKSFDQIADVPDSYLAIDDVEFGYGNRIPLWMFGLLY